MQETNRLAEPNGKPPAVAVGEFFKKNQLLLGCNLQLQTNLRASAFVFVEEFVARPRLIQASPSFKPTLLTHGFDVFN